MMFSAINRHKRIWKIRPSYLRNVLIGYRHACLLQAPKPVSKPNPIKTNGKVAKRKLDPVAICNDAESVSNALQKLQQAPYILMDAEGHLMAKGSGKGPQISLVQLGTPDAVDVYLFDMVALHTPRAKSVLRNLLAVFSDKKVLKVGWGGSQDIAAINAYGTAVTPYLDLQIVDVQSRIRRKEDYEQHIGRLVCETLPEREIRKLEVEGVHALSRMDAALLEHNLTEVPRKEGHKGRWMDRPLHHPEARYAAGDIVRISALFDHFRRQGLIRAGPLTDFIVQTTHYLKAINSRTDNMFFTANILPMGVLDLNSKNIGFFTRNKDGKNCARCKRLLNIDCFPTLEHKSPSVSGKRSKSSGSKKSRGSICRVCTFIMKREESVIQSALSRSSEIIGNYLK